MKYLDITRTISSGMKGYPTDPAVSVSEFKSLKKGNSCNLSRLDFGSHTGTHVDAPRHILEKGKGVDAVGIKDLFCNVIVTEIAGFSTRAFLKGAHLRKPSGVLFKSRTGEKGITVGLAEMIVRNRIKVVGIDRMSIEESLDRSHPVHRTLLKHGVIIIENLNLKGVKKGRYGLVCLPLKIKNGDGAPARAVLIK